MTAFLEIIKAIIFGIVEGITEWLPVSSTGHMIILQDFMPLTVSQGFWKMFEVVIQLGAIMAVVLLFWKKLWPLKKVEGKTFVKTGTIKLWIKIVIACLPAAIVGIIFDDLIDEHFYNPAMVSAALIVVGIMFIYIESKIDFTKNTEVVKNSISIINVGDVSLDTEARDLNIAGKNINLTAKEFDIFELLLTNPNKVYSREQLLNIVWGSKVNNSSDLRTVDVHVRRLREKVEPEPSNPKYIHTKWGIGYYFK